MSCQKCNSQRLGSVTAKCSDRCSAEVNSVAIEGYVPNDLGIGGGDYVEFNWCLDCGQMQGKFPRPVAEIEKDISDEEVAEFYENYFVEGTRIPFAHHINQERLQLAERLCSKFARFLFQFLNENRASRMPSVNKFIEMYRNGITNLED